MGISGRIAEYFLRNSLTPLIALIALLLGVFATMITPREEEPQINVTMANVFVPFPGASAKDVESLVARPAEQVLSRIAGIEHVYSVSRPGMAVITVQYVVGEEPIQVWGNRRLAHRTSSSAERPDSSMHFSSDMRIRCVA